MIRKFKEGDRVYYKPCNLDITKMPSSGVATIVAFTKFYCKALAAMDKSGVNAWIIRYAQNPYDVVVIEQELELITPLEELALQA